MAIENTNLNPFDSGQRINLREILKRRPETPNTIDEPQPYATIESVDVRQVLKAAYQRPLTDAKVRKIMREWDWIVFGLPEISLRADGSQFVIDGQHRIVAVTRMAAQDGRSPLLPMIVWHGFTPEQEARRFAGSQDSRNRTAVLPEHIHNAYVFAEDDQATRINAVIRDIGYRIGADGEGKRIKAVQGLYVIEERYGIDMVESVLTLITTAWGMAETPERPLMEGIATFMAMYPDAHYSSIVKRLQKKPMAQWVKESDERGRVLKIRNKGDRIASALHAEHNGARYKNPLAPFDESLAAHRSAVTSASIKKARARDAK